ncbi:hypothetical protein [Cohnella sp. GCM10012308]|uniref:hypothetical protein n=1 Tax=Cohnella sp. GCM10012308 TaxID=3317329 RepID=UPI003613E124
MNKQSAAVGIWILAAGLIILLGKLGVFSFIGAVFWPILILIVGILLHVLYFGGIVPAVALVPAGILTGSSLLLMVGNWVGWGSMRYVWPLFLLSIAIGLYEYAVFGVGKDRAVWNAAMGIGALSLLLFAIMLLWTWGIYLLAAALIGFGVWLVLSRRKPRRRRR